MFMLIKLFGKQTFTSAVPDVERSSSADCSTPEIGFGFGEYYFLNRQQNEKTIKIRFS